MNTEPAHAAPTPDKRPGAASGKAHRPPAAQSPDSPPVPLSAERRRGDRRSSLDRRRGPGRRRTDYRRAAEEGHMTEEQVDFLRAIDEYKRVNNRPFPTWTEVLDVVLYLGYRIVAPVGEFKMTKPRQTPLRKERTPEADA